MSITTTTHLNFRGDARAALEFYGSVFGGRVTIVTYGDSGMPAEASGADHVVFGQVETGDGFRVMGYDIPGRTDGSTETAGSTRRENGVTLTDRPSSSPFAARAWTRCRAIGTSCPSVPPSSSLSPPRRGAPASGCSPTASE